MRVQPSFWFFIAGLFIFSRDGYGQENWFRPVEANDCKNFRYLSIAYADENLRTPVSMFGHTFLVLHSETQPEADAMAVEFLGDMSSSDFPAFNALFGSIEGEFKVRRLIYKLLEYGREGRSIHYWTIGTVTDNCVKILSENTKKVLEYTFLRRNCSWYTAELARQLLGQSNSSEQLTLAPITLPVKTLAQFVPQDANPSATWVSSRHLATLRYRNLNFAQRANLELMMRGYSLPCPGADPAACGSAEVIAGVKINDEWREDERRYFFLAKKKLSYLMLATKPNEPKLVVNRKVSAIGLGIDPIAKNMRLSGHVGLRDLKMAKAETATTGEMNIFDIDLGIHRDKIQVNRVGIFRVDASVPGSPVMAGFTRHIDLSHDEFHYRNSKLIQKETGLRFGGGKSIDYAGLNLAAFAVGTLRYFQIPASESSETAKQKNGVCLRGSFRFRSTWLLSDHDRGVLIAERFLNDYLPLRSRVEFLQVHDLTDSASAYVSLSALGVRQRREFSSSWVLGLSVSI